MKKNILFFFSSTIFLMNIVLCLQAQVVGAGQRVDIPTDNRFAGSCKVGYVDPYKVMQKCDQARDDEKRIVGELQTRSKVIETAYAELNKINEELKSMGSTVKQEIREAKIEKARELQKSIEVKGQGLEEYRARASQEAQMAIFKEMEEVAEEIRKEEGYDIILASGALAVDPKIDLSDKVAERMNKRHAAKKERQAPKAGLTTSAKPQLPVSTNSVK